MMGALNMRVPYGLIKLAGKLNFGKNNGDYGKRTEKEKMPERNFKIRNLIHIMKIL
jgi:hypothetical protein